MANKEKLPLIALRDAVIFPNTTVPIFFGRSKSLKALLSAKNNDTDDRHLLLALQKHQSQEDPDINDIYTTGVIARVIQTIKLQDTTAKVLVEAIDRVELHNISKDDIFLSDFRIVEDKKITDDSEIKRLVTDAIELFAVYAKHNDKISPEFLRTISLQAELQDKNFPFISGMLVSYMSVPLLIKQALLEERDPVERIKLVMDVLTSGIGHFGIEQSMQQKVKKQIEKTQRDYYLHEQMKVIQKELEEDKSDLREFDKKIKSLKLSKEAREKAELELKKLRSMNQLSAESSITRNYLETLLSLPWGILDKNKIDIDHAQKILDRDHFGLEKIKERIVEYLAVLQRAKKIKGPILCLIGPPGVGKTSLVKSIAESIGRKYAKFSLGGIRDEAEIRGHRKTYVGAMPGKLISLIKKSKVSNPVILLDEIDKMGADYRGDPASAMLEVLDHEQNSSFVDHYIEVGFNLSNVMFIATSNSYNIPRPLLDRMELIDISGYIEAEKIQIAKDYLIPKQLTQHCIAKDEIIIKDEVILDLIRYYTRESGVRGLEREISSIIRKALKNILHDKTIKNVVISSSDLEAYLGVRKYNFGLAKKEDKIGSTTGLAYTEVGGELLTIEAISFPGKGNVTTTGKLGDVMKESAQAAYSCFRTRAADFGLKYDDYKDLDIHLHFPAGAVPKDGPSAGIAIFTTIVSLMTKTPVRKTVAMTGEINLKGDVLPVGGLREKFLAASRGGVLTILIPEENVKDLKEIPANLKDSLEILPVSNIDQVLHFALVDNDFTCLKD